MLFPRLWTRNLLLLFFGLGIGFIACEIALHLVGFSFIKFTRWDSDIGSSLDPHIEGWYTREGKSYVRINSAGLRDREHSTSKPENTLRIAVLGDSYAEAMHVPMENTFWSILEGKLKECQSVKEESIEVLNFGVSGYGTDRELLTLRHKVWQYDPDIVFLAFLTGNDIRNNSHRLEPKNKIPFFYYKDGQLTLDDSFKESEYFLKRQKWHFKFIYWIYNKSRVTQIINKIRLGMENQRLLKEGNDLQELGLDDLIYRAPDDEVWKEAWKLTEDLIGLVGDEVQQKKRKFMLATLSNGIQVDPDPSKRQEYMKKLGIEHLFYPDHRIKNLGAKKGFPVFNLAPEFQAFAEKNQVFLHGFDGNLGRGHWNSDGHRLAGELIAGNICKNL